MSSGADPGKERVRDALVRAGGNRTLAARDLGVGRATLYRWMQRYGIVDDVPRLIDGRFEVLEILGEGGHATVYRVREARGKRRVLALKLLHSAPADETDRERFLREFRTLSLLRHPGLVRVHDFSVDGLSGRPFFVMDLVPGVPFLDAVAGRGARFLAAALDRALLALDHLHRQGLVHRDVSSANLLVVPGSDPARPEAVTLMDLGLIESLGDQPAPVAGTASYIAPELLLGGRATPRSDLFALGSLAKHALEGADRSDAGYAVIESVARRLAHDEPAGRFPDAASARADLAVLLDAGDSQRRRARDLDLVGRQEELDRIRGWVRSPSAGAPVDDASEVPAAPPLGVVIADAGLGKSRLLAAAADDARAQGQRVASVTCREAPGSALAPIASILAALFAGSGRTGARETALRRRHAEALAAIDPTLCVDAPADPTPPSRVQVLDAVAAMLVEVVRAGPVLIVLDDLHLADPVVFDLLAHVARRARGTPLRILGAMRPATDERRAPGAFARAVEAEGLGWSLALGPLSEPAVHELATACLGAARASLLAERLWQATSGHPLFVEELLEDLVERASEDRLDRGDAHPRGIRDVIRRRLDRTDAHEHGVLAALSVAEHPASDADLDAVVGPGSSAIAAQLAVRGLVRVTPDASFEFAHALLAEEARARLPEDESNAWHRAWARRLEERGAPVALRARHVLEADPGPHSVPLFIDAAEALFATWDYRASTRFYDAALRLIPAEDPKRLELLARLARASREARDLERASAACVEWADSARRLDRTVEEARALCALAGVRRESLDWAGAHEAAARAVDLAEAGQDHRVASVALATLATILWETWHHREALGPLERAVALAEASGDLRTHANNLHDIAMPYTFAGRPAAGLASVDRARRIYRRLEDERWSLLCDANEALLLAYLGDTDDAVSRARATIDRLGEIGAAAPRQLALENLLFLLNRLGRYTEALETGRHLIDAASSSSRHENRIAGLIGMGEAHFQLDERDAARDYHRLAHELAQVFDEPRQALYALLAIARDHREDGRLDAARIEAGRVFDEARARGYHRQRAFAALELARICLDEDDAQRAHRWLDDADLPLDTSCEDAPALWAAVRLARARAWEHARDFGLALAAADEGLGFAAHRGPADVEVGLHAIRARLLHAQGRESEGRAASRAAAAAVERIASQIDDPVRRARLRERPEYAALLGWARRNRDPNEAIGEPAALAAFFEIARALANGGDLDPLLQRIVEIAVREAGAERGLLVLRDTRGSYEVAASLGIDGADASDALTVSRTTLAAAQSGTPTLATDALHDPGLRQAASVRVFGIRSLMCVPLVTGGEVMGCLYVDTRHARAGFGEPELRYLEALASHAALTIGYGRLVDRFAREREVFAATRGDKYHFGAMVSRSAAMKRVFDKLARAAESDVSVIIRGESGTGKDLAARAVHELSARRARGFHVENCSAIADAVLESELFGHVRGAFTGADVDRAGIFERANGGTILLDEVGEMSPAMQAKLLRVLEDGDVRRVGGNEVIRCDVRVISATHRNLEELVESGHFRHDLYFRLKGISAEIPPLRERKEDVALLATHLLARECVRQARSVPAIAPSVMRILTAYDWPGNVRQLQNVVIRMLLYSEGDVLSPATLENDPDVGELARVVPAVGAGSRQGRAGSEGADARRERFRKALAETGSVADAARRVGVPRATAYRWKREFEL